MSITRIAVLGAGIMGSGIAQLAASRGYEVIVEDIKDSIVYKAIQTIDKYLLKDVEKEKLTHSQYEEIKYRLHTTTRLKDAVEEADLIIEAVPENMETKKELIKKANDFISDRTIFASNTSSLSITEMASVYRHPDRFIGLHFFQPVPLMKPVELVKGLATSEETARVVAEVAERMGKTVINVKESPGLVWNRIYVPMMNEAIYTYMEGLATAEGIDTLAKLANATPIGPLALADLIGLDTLLMIMEVLYHEFSDSKYRPCPLLRKMVRAEYLGRKTGRGFFKYP
ncbi:MAG: 3-hydroxybutyryl-CoA dehydrogenase [Desulfobacteraceae bacterium]|nr:3-hydroxybutyryl-CoA dehydrogenase [Desulfobacteraceae bacterium]